MLIWHSWKETNDYEKTKLVVVIQISFKLLTIYKIVIQISFKLLTIYKIGKKIVCGNKIRSNCLKNREIISKFVALIYF